MNKISAAQAREIALSQTAETKFLQRIFREIEKNAKIGLLSCCIEFNDHILSAANIKIIVEQLRELGYNVSNGDDQAYENMYYINW